MDVTDMSLSKYLQEIRRRAKMQDYNWVIMLIGRRAEADIVYEEIKEKWASLNDLTYNRILFVFSMGGDINNNEFFHTRGRESYVGKSCPYARIVGDDSLADNHCCRYEEMWDNHSQSISEFIEDYNISESDLPGIFIENIRTQQHDFIPIENKTGIYSFIKDFVVKTKKLDKKYGDIYKFVDNVDKKLEQERELNEYADSQDVATKRTIHMVIDGKADYRENKDCFKSKEIQTIYKSFGQLKRRLTPDIITSVNEAKEAINKLLVNIKDNGNGAEDGCVKDTKINNDELCFDLKKPTFVFLADDWGCKFGGINVFNYYLCEAMARITQIDTICISPNINVEVKRAAESLGLTLINVTKEDFNSPEAIMNEVINSRALEGENTVFVGHDIITGNIAYGCKKLLKGSKLAIIHHMSYRDYYPIVNNDSAMVKQKEKEQKTVLSKADYIFANGPVLRDSAEDLVRGLNVPVSEILPGLVIVAPNTEPNNSFSVVSFGRMEKQEGNKKDNSIIKQTYLATAGWAAFSDKYVKDKSKTTMKLYGKKEGDFETQEVLKRIVEKYTSHVLSISAFEYIDNHAELMDELKSFSACLILSLREGFGLTALEAVSAGIPLVVSKSSGFYKALEERKIENYVYGVDIKGSNEEPYYNEEDVSNVCEELYNIFMNQVKAKKDALELIDKLKKLGFTWDKCAEDIVLKLFPGITIFSPLPEEKSVVKEILNSFNRPVFTTEFYAENSAEEFYSGLKDTISIINTGMETRNRSRINKYCVKDCSEEIKKDFSLITNGINTINKIFNLAEKDGIIDVYAQFYNVKDFDFCSLMNELRVVILQGASIIAKKVGLNFPDFEVSYWDGNNSGIEMDLHSLNDRMMDMYAEYKRKTKQRSLFS